jgi:hypothetical protein
MTPDAVNHLWFLKNELMKVCTFLVVENQIKFTHVLLQGELITRPKESYRLWCVVVCDLETSWMRRPWPTVGLSHYKQTNEQTTSRSASFAVLLHFRSNLLGLLGDDPVLTALIQFTWALSKRQCTKQTLPKQWNSLLFFYIRKDGRKLFL